MEFQKSTKQVGNWLAAPVVSFELLESDCKLLLSDVIAR